MEQWVWIQLQPGWGKEMANTLTLLPFTLLLVSSESQSYLDAREPKMLGDASYWGQLSGAQKRVEKARQWCGLVRGKWRTIGTVCWYTSVRISLPFGCINIWKRSYLLTNIFIAAEQQNRDTDQSSNFPSWLRSCLYSTKSSMYSTITVIYLYVCACVTLWTPGPLDYEVPFLLSWSLQHLVWCLACRN